MKVMRAHTYWVKLHTALGVGTMAGAETCTGEAIPINLTWNTVKGAFTSPGITHTGGASATALSTTLTNSRALVFLRRVDIRETYNSGYLPSVNAQDNGHSIL